MMWDTVIGLEVHAQLKTKSKLFSRTSTDFGATANSQVSYIDAGLPGVLPVLNQEAVNMALQFGLAINATINNNSFFERKNYFYPDLPKGYQISQYQCPIVSDGYLTIETREGLHKKITIARAHLEEDAGKSIHELDNGHTGIDLNRAGIPLLEIVTTPCLSSSEEVLEYLKSLHQLIRFLGICDGNMQEGSFRCDVNISLKPEGSPTLGVRTELKNLNSFKFIDKAIAYEQARHQDHLERGCTLRQETRLFCPETEKTISMRAKEQEQDYRYFPDPDLLPIFINSDTLETLRKALPPLPQKIQTELRNHTQLNEEDIHFLLASPSNWQFFNAVKQQGSIEDKTVCNWMKGIYSAALKEHQETFENPPISAQRIAELLQYLEKKLISNSMARQVFNKWLAGVNASVEETIEKEGLVEVKDSALLTSIIDSLIKKYPDQVQEYRQGRIKLLAFFVGQVMKETKGQASAEEVNRLLQQYL